MSIATDALKLEVCAFGIHSCEIAQRAGAARVELCDNPTDGGTTPSYGCIRQARELLSIDLYPIIRPRSMNYWYDEQEWAMVLHDVRMCKELGCDGVSVGISLQNGRVDVERMKRLVELAYPMGVTSNRVIDAAPDVFEALEDLVAAGCERVLTSGQASSAPEGAAVLAQLVAQAADRIIVMPGAGVRASNIAALRAATGATEFHSSARLLAPNLVTSTNDKVLDAGTYWVADEAELRAMVQALQ